MRIPLEINGVSGSLEVEPAGWFRPARLFLDGQPAPKGPKRNQYLISQDDGISKLLQLKQVFIDPVPQVLLDGELIQLAEPLSVFQWIWSAIPIVLIFLGGAIGGGIGGAAFWINTRIFRSEMSNTEQYILCGLVSGIAFFVYLIFSTVFVLLIS
jgi:hypothetical protein